MLRLNALDLEEDGGGEPDRLRTEEPLLAASYGASIRGLDALGPRAGRPTLRVLDEGRALLRGGHKPGVAVVRG